MTRKYNMENRSARTAQTRERILRAASSVYARDGFKKGSIQSIARSADVSPATVLNHFTTPDEILLAALELLQNDLKLSSPEEIKNAGNLKERLTLLISERLQAVHDTQDWQDLFQREKDLPILQHAINGFINQITDMARAAIGSHYENPTTFAIFMTLTGPYFAKQLDRNGIPKSEIQATMLDVVLTLLNSNQGEK